MRYPLFFLTLALFACSDDASTSTAPRCITNQQIACPCAGTTEQGVQTCLPDGTYSACQCPSVQGGAGGESGSSGQSGAGGEAGAGAGGGAGGAGGAAGAGGAGAAGAPAGAGGTAGAGGNGGGPGGAGGAPAGAGGAPAGAGGAPAGTAARPAVMLVVDRSGSTEESGRFAALQGALKALVSSEPGVIQVGLVRFPEGNFDDNQLASCLLNSTPECKQITADGGCKDIASPPNVPLGLLSSTKASIVSLLDSTNPLGGTPSRWALKAAWSALMPVKAAGGRHVVLISDGTPTVFQPSNGFFPDLNVECGTEQLILQEAKQMAEGADPIFTHAVGMPAEEFTAGQWLSVLAQAAKTAPPGCNGAQAQCHHKGQTEKAMLEALQRIFRSAAGCRYELPAGLSSPFTVRVNLGNGLMTVPQGKGQQDGWDLDSPGVIRFFGPICEQLQQGPVSQVQVQEICDP